MTLDLIINLIGLVPLGKNETMVSFSVIVLCSISIALIAIKSEKKQELFNRWNMFLHYSNIKHEDSLRSKDSTDFTPYSELLKEFSLKEIKMLKKNNYFKLSFNIEGYELFHSILTVFIEVINKIDFEKIKLN